MKEIEKCKTEDKNPIKILDSIEEVKYKISFLTTAITSILEHNEYSSDIVCGLQAFMFPLENDLDKISSMPKEILDYPNVVIKDAEAK